MIKMDCSYCGDSMEAGTGKMFVKNDGKIFYFCKSKCQKGMLKLGRDPAEVNWIRKKK